MKTLVESAEPGRITVKASQNARCQPVDRIEENAAWRRRESALDRSRFFERPPRHDNGLMSAPLSGALAARDAHPPDAAAARVGDASDVRRQRQSRHPLPELVALAFFRRLGLTLGVPGLGSRPSGQWHVTEKWWDHVIVLLAKLGKVV